MITTTIQKFHAAIKDGEPALDEREDIFVLVDEAHRAQASSYAARMRHALPNACFIAFTATPTTTTQRVFGEYIHVYSLEQAVVDRARVPIYYEPRVYAASVDGGGLDSAIVGVSSRIEAIEIARTRLA